MTKRTRKRKAEGRLGCVPQQCVADKTDTLNTVCNGSGTSRIYRVTGNRTSGQKRHKKPHIGPETAQETAQETAKPTVPSPSNSCVLISSSPPDRLEPWLLLSAYCSASWRRMAAMRSASIQSINTSKGLCTGPGACMAFNIVSIQASQCQSIQASHSSTFGSLDGEHA